MSNNDYVKKWRKNNPEKVKESNKKSYIKRAKKHCKNTDKYRKERPWLRFFVNAKQRCTNPNNPNYKWYGAKGIRFKLTMSEIKELWFRDNAYELENPSIDRIDCSGDYEFSNCQFIERWVNVKKKVEGE